MIVGDTKTATIIISPPTFHYKPANELKQGEMQM